MQIGIGGAAGDAYDPLRQYLPNPALGPHDPTTAVQLAALVLIKDKGAPTGQPIDTYLPYAAAYNGTGPAATAYATRVIADANTYQGTGQTTFVGLSSAGCSTPRLRHRLRQPVRPRPGHPIADRPRRRLQRHRPDRRARTRPRRPRKHHRHRLGQRQRLDLIPTHRRRIRRRLRLRRRRHHPNRPPRRARLSRLADRRLQRPLDRNRLRARPRRPRPRPHRLPRRRRHRRRTHDERTPHLARRRRRAPGPDQLRRTMPDHRRTSADRRVRQPLACSSVHFRNANLIANTELDIAPPRTIWGSTGLRGNGRSSAQSRSGSATADVRAMTAPPWLASTSASQSGGGDGRRSAPRSWRSSDPGGSSRPACTSAPAGSLAAILQARRAGACSVSAQLRSLVDFDSRRAFENCGAGIPVPCIHQDWGVCASRHGDGRTSDGEMHGCGEMRDGTDPHEEPCLRARTGIRRLRRRRGSRSGQR